MSKAPTGHEDCSLAAPESAPMTDAKHLDALLDALDEADARLRALYRTLADDPDRAAEQEANLKALHARRLDLAQRVGFVALAARRSARKPKAMAEELPAVAPDTIDATDGVSAPAPAAPAVAEPEPEPGVPVSEPAPSPPASATDVAQWTTTVRATGLGSVKTGPSGATAWPLVLHELMAVVGPPRDLGTTIAVIEELDALDAVASDERRELWARPPKSVQQLWLAMLVARTRALKELPSATPGTRGRVKVTIGRYPAWASTYMPGYVNGMQVKHEPQHGSWANDARRHWEGLLALLGEEPTSTRRPTPMKKARPEADDVDDKPEIDPGWRLLPVVRGLKAVILGGDPREPNRKRLERAFQLASLDWPPIDGPRKVDAVVGRISKGSYGLVLVLQPFVAHKAADPIIETAKSAGVPWALVESYGVEAVRAGLERFLGGPRSGVSLLREDDEGPDAEGLRGGRGTR